MNCWEEQAEVTDDSCKSSQLSMAHSSFQRRISAGFCTCLTIKIKSCGLWVEAVLKYLYALSWLYYHQCCLPKWIKEEREYFSCLGLAVWFVRDKRAWPIHHPRCCQWPHSLAKCDLVLGKHCRGVAVPEFWSQAGIRSCVMRFRFLSQRLTVISCLSSCSHAKFSASWFTQCF